MAKLGVPEVEVYQNERSPSGESKTEFGVCYQVWSDRELFDIVYNVSKYVTANRDNVDVDDLAQELWIYRFEDRNGRVWASRYDDSKELFRMLVKYGAIVAGEMVRKEMQQGYSQQYGVDRVKDLLNGKGLDAAATTDLAEAMDWLRIEHPSEAQAVVTRHGLRKPLSTSERKAIQRAYEHLTDEMNRLYFQGSRDAEFFVMAGPGLSPEQTEVIFGLEV